ncbi:hypothetical protein G7B40_020230 [Aetokthonos hydrillicola Thurmond2011]|jgi:hypothetical protein|uniref:Uncharacterized protein n=1 Tax=Aetokthonos hydrillicola Thurmond2011 TaxID=2712845 RepID=A0AAP5I8S0_9CYAN|nr:hypothetical protein [Aetokthonos hydrillicola]MBW4590335.1 hypothetical protein [Aetokthonos hydrillicola CCALA 1050]MDR9896875.1 hypothetical protein [Aetokthonos hydrillicola Thurmond2011]
MQDKILERILTTSEAPEILDILTNRLSLSDLQSLLLEVYRRRTASLTPSQLLQQYEKNRFTTPSQVNPQYILEFDRLAYSLLPQGFEVLELSPVCPLGSNSVVATVNQNKVLTTVRNTEVTADATNVMALECAKRRRNFAKQSVEFTKLCTSHRVLRAQGMNKPASFPHFRLLALCTAGRDRGSYNFEIEALTEHLEFYLRLFAAANNTGFTLTNVGVLLTAFDETRYNTLQTLVLEKLATKYQQTTFGFNQERETGRAYYSGAAFHIYARNSSGTEYFLVDGGFTDWTQQLLNNRKERLLISGMGSERFVLYFC